MSKISTSLIQLAQGKFPAVPFSMTWVVHKGFRGATWLSIWSDGMVIESRYAPEMGLGATLPQTSPGSVPLAAVKDLASGILSEGYESIPVLPDEDPTFSTSNLFDVEITAGEERWMRRVPAAQLRDVPAMKRIGALFARLRARFHDLPTLICPDCETPYTLPSVFDFCEFSIPAGPWLYFFCPNCDSMWVLEPGPQTVSLGMLDEFPPNPGQLEPIIELDAPSLDFAVIPDGVHLSFGDLTWLVRIASLGT